MNKHNISFIVLLLLVSLTVMCNKSETLVEPESGAEQVLVVTEEDDENPEEILKDNPKCFSQLTLFRSHINYSDTIPYGYQTNYINSSISITNTLSSKNDTLHSFRCECVELGGLLFRERHCNAPGTGCGSYRGGGGKSYWIDWEYEFAEQCLDEDSQLSRLIGQTELKIMGSDSIQDVQTTINIPKPNTIITPQAGAIIDLNKDLVIKLKKPAGEIYSSGRIHYYWGRIGFAINREHGGCPLTKIFISTKDTRIQVIVPQSTLREFYESFPNEEYFFIGVYSIYFLDTPEIPLYDKNGNLADNIFLFICDEEYIQVTFNR